MHFQQGVWGPVGWEGWEGKAKNKSHTQSTGTASIACMQGTHGIDPVGWDNEELFSSRTAFFTVSDDSMEGVDMHML